MIERVHIQWRDDWPDELIQFLQDFGESPVAITSLRGMSQNRVWCVKFTITSLVVKAARTTTEMQFYQHIAPALHAQGVATPQLVWATRHEESAWLVLEYIPAPLPQARWHADSTVLTTLHRLHHATLPTATFPLFVPAWTEDFTEAAVAQLPADHRPHMRRMLHALQAQSQGIFTSQCWISGDPNPLNRGIRLDEVVVLYDWERFGRGTPALDLAITLPGLGSWSAFEHVATQYLAAQLRQDAGMAAHMLAQQIALAKVWNVVEFLYLVATEKVTPMGDTTALVQQLPMWVESIASESP